MTASQGISTKEVMEVARARFSQLSSQKRIDISMIEHFFDAAQSGLSGEEIKDVELALLLLASAHNSGNQYFDDAHKFLNLCDFLASKMGNSVQRVVYYFSKALQERICNESGTATFQGLQNRKKLLCPEETAVSSNISLIKCSIQIPYIQVAHFAGVQAVVDSLGSAKKIHLIDFAIRSGGHCIVLMQALATRRERPIELLKVTAVGTKSNKEFQETGRRLKAFAETLSIPFLFRSAVVENIKDVKEDSFDLNEGEVIVVYFWAILRSVKAEPGGLESLLTMLRSLKPRVMVIIELEANHNTTVFMDRFLEALLYYSACFDCFQVCIDRCDPNRAAIEEHLGLEIRDIVAAEDEERMFWHMKIDDWRGYFSRFCMAERELSPTAFYQSELLLKMYASGSSCTVNRNEKCLISGWKGSPILSVSAWKFRRQKRSWGER